MREKKSLTLANGPRMEVGDIQFQVLDAAETRMWVVQKSTGRFSALREGLVTQLKTLRKNESLTFTAPEDIKEIKNILNACKGAIREFQLPWKVRHSALKNCIVVIHETQLSKRREETV